MWTEVSQYDTEKMVVVQLFASEHNKGEEHNEIQVKINEGRYEIG